MPLVVGADGERLAKRHGAVTLVELAHIGRGPSEVISWIGESLDLAAAGEEVTARTLLERFDPQSVPNCVVSAPDLG